MSKKILLINDMPCYGKVAINAMTPILIRRGFELFYLPTTIVSNTLNYGKYAFVDTTDFMMQTIKIWRELGFKFDAVSVGYIADDKQADIILEVCREAAEYGAKIYVDPIMADNGKFYNSVNESRTEIMKKLIAVADCVLPNLTESCFLTGTSYKENGYGADELLLITQKLCKLGAKSVIITSGLINGSKGCIYNCVIGYESQDESLTTVQYEELPVHVNGTGDTFSAAVIAELTDGASLKDALTKSVTFVEELIRNNLSILEDYNGLPIEAHIEKLQTK